MLKKLKIKFFILIILFGGAVLIWLNVFHQSPSNILEVYFFDIGQGDSIFIETPDNRQILIDGGPDESVLEKLGQTMSFYDRYIDLVVLTHSDADHITGLVSVLEYFNIGRIITSGLGKDTAVCQRWEDLIEKKNIPTSLAQSGQRIILGDNLVLEIIWPEQSLIGSYSEPANNVSVVGRLVYGNSEILLTGDIEKKVENYLVSQNYGLDSDILKAAHHGSKTSTSEGFLNSVSPGLAVISVGEDNRFDHPSPEVLERLKDIFVLRTDLNGDIKLETDGNSFWLEVEK